MLEQMNIAASHYLAISTRETIVLDRNRKIPRSEKLLSTINQWDGLDHTAVGKTKCQQIGRTSIAGSNNNNRANTYHCCQQSCNNQLPAKVRSAKQKIQTRYCLLVENFRSNLADFPRSLRMSSITRFYGSIRNSLNKRTQVRKSESSK